MSLSDAEKLISQSFLSELLERIDARWSAEKCAGLMLADDAFSAFDEEIEMTRSSSRDISERLDNALRTIKAKFQQVTSRVSSHRNRLPSINRLPVEVLRSVFQSVSSCGLHHAQNISIMSVCAYWRSVVLHDAKMWTVVDFARVGRRYATMAVERSSPLPLDILGGKSWNYQQWAPGIVATNLSRVRRLELNFDLDEIKPQAPFDGLQAPILTHLRLCGMSEYEIDDMYFHPLLLVHSPRLRYLDLLDCPFPWNTGMYASLTTLKIEIEDLDTSIIFYFPGGDVTSVVRECPQLEHLTINFEDQGAGDRVPDIVEETEMRRLRVLVVKLPEKYLVYFMKCLVLPSIDILRLTAYQCNEPNAVAQLFHLHRIPDTLLATIAALCTSRVDKTYTIKGFPALKGSSWPNDSIILKVEVKLKGSLEDQLEYPLKPLLAGIRENHTLPNLKTVRFRGVRGVDDFYDRQWPSYTREMTLFMIHNPTIRFITFDLHSKRRYATSLDEIRAALAEVVLSRGTWPLPNLLSCTFISYDSGPNCEPCTTGILRFLKFVTSHKSLSTLRIRCGRVIVEERSSALQLISDIRALQIPTIWWSKTYFDITTAAVSEGFSSTVTAGDLWPRRERYNWRCTQDATHRSEPESVVNCCRGRNRFAAHGYSHGTHETADMYDIAQDWANLLDKNSDDTVASVKI